MYCRNPAKYFTIDIYTLLLRLACVESYLEKRHFIIISAGSQQSSQIFSAAGQPSGSLHFFAGQNPILLDSSIYYHCNFGNFCPTFV